MKTTVFFLTILFLFFINAYAQYERLERPLNKEGILNDFSKPAFFDSTQLDSIINYSMNTNHIPGLAALINSKENGIIWKQNYGYSNISLNQPVEDSTLFIIASISKTIVATAIMQFWEADSFDLDDNVNDYLDEFQVHIPNYYNDTVTFRMILTHTSSISDNWNVLDGLTICGDSPIPLDYFLINYFTPGGRYYNPTINFVNAKPGTVWQYSNVAICILAYFVEKFSGMPFNQYCKANIFNPLEMSKTSWFLEGMDTTEIATPYLWQGGQYVPYCHYGCPDYPDGQLRTNKIELEHLLSAYMNWGKYNGATILDSSTVDLILSNQLGYPNVYGDYQGLIWWQQSDLNGRWPWGHTGGWLGCTTGMFFQQDEQWGIILFMNSSTTYQTLRYLLNLLCDYAQHTTEVAEVRNPISNYRLEQNYPNPFNPSTKIRYIVPKLSRVLIKVFNVLGSEVEVLVNEERQTGTYELTWNAANLPSGVYFYQLKAGSFINTRKMILLR